MALMSLKTVELQVALPRTTEVGRIQEQYQHRLTNEQHLLQQEQKGIDQQKSQRAAEVNETDKNQLRDKERQDQQGSKESALEASTKQAAQSPGNGGTASGEVAMRDPLRGRYIDISL
jgi:hypothetical protein